MLTELFILFFTLFITFSSFSVVTTYNPVHAVFFLILTFSISSLFLLFFQVDFLALLFIVVYVGAIAVLFLFVVMMLDLRNLESEVKDQEIFETFAFSLFMFIFFVLTLYVFNFLLFMTNELPPLHLPYLEFTKFIEGPTNIQVIGELLYTFYSPVFLLAGYILLVAMLGSIMLTLKHHINSRKQNAFFQLEKDAINSLRRL